MGRIVTVTVVDLTRPIEQKGFKSVALFDFTTELAPMKITDTSALQAGSDILKAATAFFANGGSDLLVAGKAVVSDLEVFDFLTLVAETNDFYGVNVIIPKANQLAYVEQVKLFVEGTQKLSVVEVNGLATEVQTVVDTLNSDRVVVFANAEDAIEGYGSAVSGICFPQDEGSITWGNKAVTGSPSSGYSPADEDILLADNINYVTEEKGLTITQFGRTLSGSNADVTRSKDWLNNRLAENLTATLVNSKKIAFTTIDLAKIVGAMDEVGLQAVTMGMLSEFISIVPKVVDIPTNDKANRVLRGVKFIATLSGAVETIELELQVRL